MRPSIRRSHAVGGRVSFRRFGSQITIHLVPKLHLGTHLPQRVRPTGGLVAKLCFALIALLIAPLVTNAAIITVTNTNDNGPGSLRQATADAQDGDSIEFDPALNEQTITLTTAELAIAKNITISGPGSNLLGVARSSTAGTFRIFHITSGRTVTIAGLTIKNGSGPGGGVLNDHAILTIDGCVVTANLAPDSRGAGIYSNASGGSASLTILNSTINGNSASSTQTTVAGGGIYNDGSNAGNATLTIDNSLVTGNEAVLAPPFSSISGDGGGIYNDGQTATLLITNSTVSNNRAGAPQGPSPQAASGHGGGIWNSGVATISKCTISGNYSADGAGVSNTASLTVLDSFITGNMAEHGFISSGVLLSEGNGGGIYSDGGSATLTITGSTISKNQAGIPYAAPPGAVMLGHGGGVWSSSQAGITNTTISGNSATEGGGISGAAIIKHSTIAGNDGRLASGIAVVGSVEIGHTILKTGNGASFLNKVGTVTSDGYNISSDNGGGFLTGPGDQINTDPLLGPLQNNGGLTFTHMPLNGSPAIDLGDPNFIPPPLYDQRGFGYARVYNSRIDIGSVEVQPAATISPTPTATATASPSPSTTPNPTPTATATSTPAVVIISGTVSICTSAGPSGSPLPNVIMTLTGSASGSTVTDASGNYSFSVPTGGSYTITPSKAAYPPGSAGFNTTDVIGIQRQFLLIGPPFSTCRTEAADCAAPNGITVGDVIAVQRFFLGFTNGIGNVGRYKFDPFNRSYSSVTTSQFSQNYDSVVLGDVATPFVQ